MSQVHHTLGLETLSEEERRALLVQAENLTLLDGKDDEYTVLQFTDSASSPETLKSRPTSSRQ